MDSILDSIKKQLGIAPDYIEFDNDIILDINTVFMLLSQIGVGPENGFSIMDNTATWADFLPPKNENFNAVKTYMHLKVKLLFDPPQSSVVLECMKQMATEIEWRLNVEAERKILNGGIQNGTGIIK